MRPVGRLQPGVSPTQADAEIRAIAQQLAASFPDTNRDRGASARPARDGYPGERDAIVLGEGLRLAALGMVVGVAGAFGLVPAWRATRADTIVALRSE